MLALDPPLGDATIGGVVATADSGPLRHRYGAARDLILGMTVALPDGSVARSGGKVIKNVAGYDLGKLFAGSFGTLGTIVELVVRLHPRVDRSATVVMAGGDPAALAAAAARLSAAPLELDALDVSWSEGTGWVLARVSGVAAAARAERIAGLAEGLDVAVHEDAEELWSRQRDGQRGEIVLRVSGASRRARPRARGGEAARRVARGSRGCRRPLAPGVRRVGARPAPRPRPVPVRPPRRAARAARRSVGRGRCGPARALAAGEGALRPGRDVQPRRLRGRDLMTAFDALRPPSDADLDTCVHCGFCLPTCPTYVLWGEEMDSPRGRIVLMDAAAHEADAISDAMATHWDRCLGCMACVTACPSGVRYDRLLEDTRPQVERNYRRSLGARLTRRLAFATFTHPGRLRVAAPLAGLAGPARRPPPGPVAARLLPRRRHAPADPTRRAGAHAARVPESLRPRGSGAAASACSRAASSGCSSAT